MLRLRGLMAVAPLGEDPRPAYARLAADPRASSWPHTPTPPGSRPGMSGDLEAAVAAGATHVRLGTAVLGPRPRNL